MEEAAAAAAASNNILLLNQTTTRRRSSSSSSSRWRLTLLVSMRRRSRPPIIFIIIQLLLLLIMIDVIRGSEALWCVARSDASDDALQRGLDYACAAGADCGPLLENGLCFLPNTIQAHASYAFNSYYQRSNMAPGSCHFSATATLAKTDPSYGSCVYPASPSTAGLAPRTTGPYGNATTMTPTFTSPPSVDGGGTGLNPNSTITTTTDSKASLQLLADYSRLLLLEMSLFLLLSFAVF